MKKIEIVVDEQDYQNIIGAVNLKTKQEQSTNSTNSNVTVITDNEISQISPFSFGHVLSQICDEWIDSNKV